MAPPVTIASEPMPRIDGQLSEPAPHAAAAGALPPPELAPDPAAGAQQSYIGGQALFVPADAGRDLPPPQSDGSEPVGATASAADAAGQSERPASWSPFTYFKNLGKRDDG